MSRRSSQVRKRASLQFRLLDEFFDRLEARFQVQVELDRSLGQVVLGPDGEGVEVRFVAGNRLFVDVEAFAGFEQNFPIFSN